MAEYIDIDAPIDVAVYQRNRRIQVTLRQILESNDAKYECTDGVERKTGKWIDVDDYSNIISGSCSACGWQAHLYEDDVVGMNFCPNCGADMRHPDD